MLLVLQGVKVADWVAHGLGLPQYAEAFRTNSITVCSCPGKNGAVKHNVVLAPAFPVVGLQWWAVPLCLRRVTKSFQPPATAVGTHCAALSHDHVQCYAYMVPDARQQQLRLCAGRDVRLCACAAVATPDTVDRTPPHPDQSSCGVSVQMLDLPMLVNDGGKLLQTELKVGTLKTCSLSIRLKHCTRATQSSRV